MTKLIQLSSGKLRSIGDNLVSFEGATVPTECCCDDVQTCCCATALSKILTWTFGNDGTGTLAGLNGVEVSLIYRDERSDDCDEPGVLIGLIVWQADIGSLPTYNGGECTFDEFEISCTCSCEVVPPDPFAAWGHFLSDDGLGAVPDDCLNDLGGPDTIQCDPFQLTGTVMTINGDTISYTVTE